MRRQVSCTLLSNGDDPKKLILFRLFSLPSPLVALFLVFFKFPSVDVPGDRCLNLVMGRSWYVLWSEEIISDFHDGVEIGIDRR